MARVVHFEIHAENPERAIEFYRGLFAWEFTAWGSPESYWLVKTGPEGTPGINGGMVRRRGPAPADGLPVNAFVCTVEVEAIDSELAMILQLGGSIAVPRMPVPGVGWLAYGKDPDGNIFGLMQNDPAAA